MSRGNGRQAIFHSDKDRETFISLLGELSERFDIEIVAYVLMSNHYHLLIKTRNANLSKAMQWFGTCFTCAFNVSNQKSGHLFQGRFKSIVVENDGYLLRLSCYIHRNPLRARLVDRLADYNWSSYPVYAYNKKKPEWLNTSVIFDQLAGEDLNKAYRMKVQTYSDENKSIWEDVKHGLIYGSQEFIEEIKKRFLGDKNKEELPQHNRLLRTVDPEFMLKKASEYLNFDMESARISKKINPVDKDNRDLIIHLLNQTGRFSNYEIGGYFGLSYSAVSSRDKVITNRILNDQEMRLKYDELKSQIKV
jgi:REP element-mobilizing transposase RayT